MGKEIAFVAAGAHNRMHDGNNTISINADSGVNRIIYAIAHGQYTIASTTYNAVGLAYWSEPASFSFWFLKNPATGSNNFYTAMDAQGNQTCLGIVYRNVNPTNPHTNLGTGTTSTVMSSIVQGQMFIGAGGHGYEDAWTPTLTYGTPILKASSWSTPADAQRVRVYEALDADGSSNTWQITASHTVWVAGFTLNPIGGGGNQVIWAMIERWKQFMDELKSPHIGIDKLGKPKLLYPSRLRTDMDPHIVQKRFRELVTGVPY